MNARVPPPPPGAPPCPPRGAPFAAPVAGAPVPLGEALRRAVCRRAVALPPPPTRDTTHVVVDLVTVSGVAYMCLGEMELELLELTYGHSRIYAAAHNSYPLPEWAPAGRLSAVYPVRAKGPLQPIPGTRRVEITTYRGVMKFNAAVVIPRLISEVRTIPPGTNSFIGPENLSSETWAHHTMEEIGFSPLVCALDISELVRTGHSLPPRRRRYTTIPREIGLGPWVRTLEELVLPNHGLAGQIPPEIALLTRLSILVLSGNRLEGSLPSRLGEAQPGLCVVDVSGNPGLGGEVPGLLMVRGRNSSFSINIRGTGITVAPPYPAFVVRDRARRPTA